jgi:hypothetical protein
MSTESPKDILKFIQDGISKVPVIVLGSGASAAYGIAGMGKLADYLINNVEPDDVNTPTGKSLKLNLIKG